ncbi:hypothetical protein WJX77_009498 [Trebouxia sp. C0004]
MTDDIYTVLEAWVYDMAACTPADLAVSLNNTTLKIKTFGKYMDLYLGSKDECPRVFEKVNERWEVGVGLTDGRFQQISFVNGVNTYKGGKHVEYITNQITKKMVELIKKKKKKDGKSSYIKDHMMVFISKFFLRLTD